MFKCNVIVGAKAILLPWKTRIEVPIQKRELRPIKKLNLLRSAKHVLIIDVSFCSRHCWALRHQMELSPQATGNTNFAYSVIVTSHWRCNVGYFDLTFKPLEYLLIYFVLVFRFKSWHCHCSRLVTWSMTVHPAPVTFLSSRLSMRLVIWCPGPSSTRYRLLLLLNNLVCSSGGVEWPHLLFSPAN